MSKRAEFIAYMFTVAGIIVGLGFLVNMVYPAY